MRLFTIIIITFIAASIFSCKKNKDLPGNNNNLKESKGSLVDSNGLCRNSKVSGQYLPGAAMNSSNYADVFVYFSDTGHYSIITDTLNGIYFKADGTTTVTGSQSVRLTAYGTPLKTGLTIFKTSYNNTHCTLSVFTTSVVYNTLYIGGVDGFLYALDATTGNLKWKVQAGDAILSSPTIAGNLVVFGCNNQNLFAVNPYTQALEWAFSTYAGVYNNAVIRNPVFTYGKIYFPCDNSRVYSLDTSVMVVNNIKYPNVKWVSNIGPAIPTSSASNPAIGNGNLYITTSENILYALDTAKGTTKWTFSIPERATLSNPAFYNNAIYFCCGNGTIYALNSNNGTVLWKQQDGQMGANNSSPTISNGILYCGIPYLQDYRACAIDITTGKYKWISDNKNIVTVLTNSAPVTGNNAVYMTSPQGYLLSWNINTGILQWSYNTGTTIYTSPVLAKTIIYFGDSDGTVYAINALTGSLIWKNKIASGFSKSSPCVIDETGIVHHSGESGELN